MENGLPREAFARSFRGGADVTHSRECDHTRGLAQRRSTAVTVCRACRDYLCSICGVTIDWYDGLCVTNPPVQWRYCAKTACVAVEAAYHGLSFDEMIRHRDALRAKRVLDHLQDRGIEPCPKYAPPSQGGAPSIQLKMAGRPERIVITPPAFTLDPGEACWCNLGKDCTGNHEIYLAEPVHRCGLCGQTFEIKSDDPHWSTGRGPICPTAERKEEPGDPR